MIRVSKLMYSEWGNPLDVIKKCTDTLPALKTNDVLVKMIAAPMNPADMLTIKGIYPSRPELPAVPGNEGLGEVLEVGSGVKNLSVGDLVVPLTNRLGTWRTHIIIENSLLFRIPKELGLIESCTFTVNPCTAYRMLKDFVDLKPGDVVIQNGGNSACGQCVIQLAKIWNIKTVNIIRDRPNVGEIKNELRNLGATEVLTEEELIKTDLFTGGNLPKPKLALDCVGGKNAMEIMRTLDRGATFVTYGAMSGEPFMLNMMNLIFEDLRVRGFWMTEWNKNNFSNESRKIMLNDLINFMIEGKLKAAQAKIIPFDEFKVALNETLKGSGKCILKF